MAFDNLDLGAPCKGCTKRYFKCHATCEGYIRWLKKHQEKQAEIKKKLHDKDIIEGYKRQNERRLRRMYGRVKV